MHDTDLSDNVLNEFVHRESEAWEVARCVEVMR